MRSLPNLLFRSIGIILLIVVVVASCKKDPYELGLDLLPPTDTLYVDLFDTTTIQAYSVLEDSIRSDELNSLVLGSIMDPVFGKTTASFYSQFLLSSLETDFGTNPQLDSLVLVLHYQGVNGDSNTLQQVRVFEISESLIYDTSYYSNQSAGTFGLELADFTFLPRPTDSVNVYGKPEAPHLRINLSNKTHYLGNKLLYAPKSAMSSNTTFLEFFKGLYVQAMPVSSRGSLVNFTVTGAYSKLIIYFHSDDKGDSLQFTLPVDDPSARFNTFDHDGYKDASPEFKQQVLYHDTALGKNNLYLQTLAGVKIKIRLPYIRSLNDLGPIAINNAVLTMKSPETDTTFQPPPQLAMFKVDSAGKIGAIIDETEGTNYFGGTYNKGDKSYWFRITRHIQRLLVNDTLENYDLYIFASNPLAKSQTPNRVILYGTDPYFSPSEASNLKLRITYTKMQ